MKSRDKIGSGFRTFFLLAHFPQAPKTVPFLGPRFGRRSTATIFTLELAFGTVKSGRGSKKQCQMQSDTLYVASSHIRSTAAKKSRVVPARCMYTLVLAPCSNRGGPLCKGTFSTVFSGSLMNSPNREKLWVTPSRRCQQELHFPSTVIAEIM